MSVLNYKGVDTKIVKDVLRLSLLFKKQEC